MLGSIVFQDFGWQIRILLSRYLCHKSIYLRSKIIDRAIKNYYRPRCFLLYFHLFNFWHNMVCSNVHLRNILEKICALIVILGNSDFLSVSRAFSNFKLRIYIAVRFELLPILRAFFQCFSRGNQKNQSLNLSAHANSNFCS